jgi:hypothetical protein
MLLSYFPFVAYYRIDISIDQLLSIEIFYLFVEGIRKRVEGTHRSTAGAHNTPTFLPQLLVIFRQKLLCSENNIADSHRIIFIFAIVEFDFHNVCKK